MSNLPTCFETALHNIEPEEDAKNAVDAHEQVSKILIADPKLRDLGIKPLLIGSYKRSVSIKRVKDVDIFAKLENADSKLLPGETLDLFESILSSKWAFGRDRVQRQDRSIKVDFPNYGLTVDAVPARPCGDHWEIPNKPEDFERAQWVETNPLKLNELTNEANAKYLLNDKGVYVQTVKLIRQIRRTWVKDHPGGLFFEIMTYWAFQNNNLNGNSIAEYLKLALTNVSKMLPDVMRDGLNDPTLPGNKISTKATTADFENAISQIKKAADMAEKAFVEEDPCKSAVLWKSLFGKTTEGEDVFPLPTYCNPDGTKKSVDLARGALTVPPGNDRFA